METLTLTRTRLKDQFETEKNQRRAWHERHTITKGQHEYATWMYYVGRCDAVREMIEEIERKEA